RQVVEEHTVAAESLRHEDPGIPPGSESLSYLERYSRIAAGIKSFLNMNDPDWIIRDSGGNFVSGKNPPITLEDRHRRRTLTLLLYIEEKTRGTEANIGAIMADP